MGLSHHLLGMELEDTEEEWTEEGEEGPGEGRRRMKQGRERKGKKRTFMKERRGIRGKVEFWKRIGESLLRFMHILLSSCSGSPGCMLVHPSQSFRRSTWLSDQSGWKRHAVFTASMTCPTGSWKSSLLPGGTCCTLSLKKPSTLPIWGRHLPGVSPRHPDDFAPA